MQKNTMPPKEKQPDTADSLEEITVWLGTYRHRLRIARDGERLLTGEIVRRHGTRHQRRRAELA
jgi:hypothetical protein